MMDVPARLATALADRYRLERELGQGGMATVYLAEDLKHGRKVAIKVLHPELSAIIGGERFLAEIRTTASLQHPHILGLIDSGEADGLLYYVMPYIEGETLRGRLLREKQIPVEDAVRLARECAAALEFAHKRGVVHRDIKPENILLQDGSALVADFGIALAVHQAGGSRMTQTGMSLGTPAYMSPEQAMGDRDIGPRSDVYALGAMTYEMLAGEPPFTGPTSQAIVAKVLTEPSPSLRARRPTVPAAVEAAVLTALQKLPADRFAGAAQFAEALVRPGAVAMSGTTVAIPAAVGPRARVRRTVPWLVAALALAAAAWGWLARPRPAGVRWQYLSLGSVPEPMLGLPGLALSPDGENLVQATVRPPYQLWLKRRGVLEASPIPGTEDGRFPVFSPDGQWLAFIASGRLKKVRLDGTPAITLTDSAFPDFSGVAWLGNEALAFVGASGSRISRVSAEGGPLAPLVDDPALRGYGLAAPAALPGGRGIFFTVCNSGCASLAVHVLDARTGQQRRLLEDFVSAWYLPDGRLLGVRRDGTALVAPFDLDKLDLTGPLIPVLERIFVLVGSTQFAWSPSGTVVYRPASGGTSEVEVRRVSLSGAETRVDTAWHGPFNSMALSPDGRRLAVGVGLASGGLDIWVKQLDRGPFTRLTFSGRDRRPAWTADGRIVAFVRDTVGGTRIFARPVDGSDTARQLIRLDRMVQELEFSPDGRWLAVRTDNGEPGAGDILGIRLGGDATPVPLAASPSSELHPAFSPDGRWLAYSSVEGDAPDVFVRSMAEGASGRWQVSTGGGSQPRWSPDGRELYYLNLLTGEVSAARLRTEPDFEVLDRRVLFRTTSAITDPFHQAYDVLRDGSGFVVIYRRDAGVATALPPLVLGEHWFTELDARAAR